MTIYTEPYFILEEECYAIKNKVLELKDLWDNYTSPIPFSTLGNALYLMEAEGLSSARINYSVKETLTENFGWLYQKICDKVSVMTGCNTQLHPTLTVPGFHIGNTPGDYKIDRFHIDASILRYDPQSDIETVYSILIPISIPRTFGAGLQYMKDGKQFRFTYELGAFHQWKGDLEHKVGDSILFESEHRITLQCHYYHNKVNDINYVYF